MDTFEERHNKFLELLSQKQDEKDITKWEEYYQSPEEWKRVVSRCYCVEGVYIPTSFKEARCISLMALKKANWHFTNRHGY